LAPLLSTLSFPSYGPGAHPYHFTPFPFFSPLAEAFPGDSDKFTQLLASPLFCFFFSTIRLPPSSVGLWTFFLSPPSVGKTVGRSFPPLANNARADPPSFSSASISKSELYPFSRGFDHDKNPFFFSPSLVIQNRLPAFESRCPSVFFFWMAGDLLLLSFSSLGFTPAFQYRDPFLFPPPPSVEPSGGAFFQRDSWSMGVILSVPSRRDDKPFPFAGSGSFLGKRFFRCVPEPTSSSLLFFFPLKLALGMAFFFHLGSRLIFCEGCHFPPSPFSS